MCLLACLLALLPGPSPGAADLEVVIWFERARPLDTFRYQVYDLRRNQAGPALERWRADVRLHYPAYEVRTRLVRLDDVPGPTENLKIGTVVLQEFIAVGTAAGYDFAGLAPGSAGSTAPAPVSPRPLLPAMPALRPRPDLSPLPFPVPFPYPRPHP